MLLRKSTKHRTDFIYSFYFPSSLFFGVFIIFRFLCLSAHSLIYIIYIEYKPTSMYMLEEWMNAFSTEMNDDSTYEDDSLHVSFESFSSSFCLCGSLCLSLFFSLIFRRRTSRTMTEKKIDKSLETEIETWGTD